MLSEFRGHHCQHRSDDFADIAAILTPHRPRVVVELGTDRGGFAAFLANLVRPWGGTVHTFDVEAKFKATLLAEFSNLRFVQADVLGTGPLTRPTDRPRARHPYVAALAAQQGVLLYCDNGDKQSEVELYAPLLQVGSVLGVHDYNTEIMGSWVEPFVAALGYEPEGHARMEALRNQWYPEPMSRFWVRRTRQSDDREAQAPDTSQAQAPDTSQAQAPDTSQAQAPDTSQAQAPASSESRGRRRRQQLRGG